MTDFHELYTMYAGDIYRFALSLCRNREEAEDITAETFARALTGKSPLIRATVKGYLLTIARNLYLESMHRRKRYSEVPLELPDSGPIPEHSISHKTELQAVEAYLLTFPEIDRSALMLRAHGLSYDEIANVLNISVASAKVKVHRLRLKLAEWRMNREQ